MFCFEHMVNGFCIDDCEKDEKIALLDALYKRSKLSWGELKQQNRHKLGFENISRSSIRGSVPRIVTDDVQIIAFRFHGMAPMVGYRDREVFRVIWLDRAFTLYKHG
ncbi:hypothetical protein ACFQU7_10850 [Pseudoroseomonas wenyumeiae]